MNEVDLYISEFPEDTREILSRIREIILDTVPGVTEEFAYKMPAYRLNGRPLVYFAGYKNHIGFYATPTGHEKFAKELAGYKQGRGSVQFPLNKPIPYDLIREIIEFLSSRILFM